MKSVKQNVSAKKVKKCRMPQTDQITMPYTFFVGLNENVVFQLFQTKQDSVSRRNLHGLLKHPPLKKSPREQKHH